MNETAIHDLLARAYNRLADLMRSDSATVDTATFERAMDEMVRLFDPKGAFNTPSMTIDLPAPLRRAVIDLRAVMERFRDATAESAEEAVRDVWAVLSRREVVAVLRREGAAKQA